jgi:geranylgeranylglycerol-phosphate geranylgeranyltransferase
MGAVGALIASLICAGPEELLDFGEEVSLSMLVVFVFTAAGNALNDYFDRDVDRIAHPKRPIPSGAIAPSSALYLSGAMFSVTIIVSYLVGLWSLAIVISSITLMVAYERYLKAEGLAGNLTISWLTGALFLFGGAAVDRMEVASVLAALAFFATLGREIVKDIEDIEGDRGSRVTLPMRIGAGRAGYVASFAFVASVTLSPLPFILDLLSAWYLPVVAVADGMFIYCAMVHFADPGRGQKVAKFAMIVALASFLLGVVP